MDTLTDAALPEVIADAAGAASVAFTYNDPVIFAEYAIDIAAACRDRGVRTVGVTAGYVSPYAEDAAGSAREDFFGAMDAVNVDLKAFTPEFYRRITGADLDVVLDNLVWLAGTETWVEVTTLLIPGHNDSDAEIRAMADWIVANLGPDVPHHFSAFHPDNRMRDVPPTPPTTLRRARDIARDWYRMVDYQLLADASGRGSCPQCGTTVPGLYDAAGPGDFGPRRIPIRITGR